LPAASGLLQRGHLGEHGGALDEIAKLRIVEVLEVSAQDRSANVETDVATDLARDDRIVAGENLDLDAVIA
jgi:hypothetical protein